MTRSDFDVFLLGGAIICAIMSLVTLARYGSRGVSALALAGAFAALATTLWFMKIKASSDVITGGFVLVVLLLAADFALRAGGRASK